MRNTFRIVFQKKKDDCTVIINCPAGAGGKYLLKLPFPLTENKRLNCAQSNQRIESDQGTNPLPQDLASAPTAATFQASHAF